MKEIQTKLHRYQLYLIKYGIQFTNNMMFRKCQNDRFSRRGERTNIPAIELCYDPIVRIHIAPRGQIITPREFQLSR